MIISRDSYLPYSIRSPKCYSSELISTINPAKKADDIEHNTENPKKEERPTNNLVPVLEPKQLTRK